MTTIWRSEDLPRFRSTRDTRDRMDLVNRELFGTEDFIADLITMHPGDTSARHYHPISNQYVFALKGQGIHVDENGERHEIRAGDVFMVEAGKVHSGGNESDEDYVFIELWSPPYGDPKSVFVTDDACAWAPEDEAAPAEASA